MVSVLVLVLAPVRVTGPQATEGRISARSGEPCDELTSSKAHSWSAVISSHAEDKSGENI